MKSRTIWIILGVIVLILIIANWNKIFGSDKKKVGGPVTPPSTNKAKSCKCEIPDGTGGAIMIGCTDCSNKKCPCGGGKLDN